ncbi:hypothetical protein HMPREF1544_06522 [Mucor circinelloides 1006PhL]|uniref:Uncharacterized protein n=1 Tax=Mucor circinelloides f. circinelloides (strain 1006PhL) TaxID=1220926 RepID=S2JV21_MUCC1|nr:hypothetical protein HMPREF1544_06522 [Mucor circinelloides 1006PhL]
MIIFPQYNTTAKNCHISKFGSSAYNHTASIETKLDYHVKSALTKDLLSDAASITKRLPLRTLIRLFKTTKHVWMYLLFIVCRYHQAFRSAISPSVMPPYDIIVKESLDAIRNCEKLDDALFQIFLLYKTNIAEHERVRYLDYSKKLSRSDILLTAIISTNTTVSDAQGKEATEASGLSRVDTLTATSKESDPLDNGDNVDVTNESIRSNNEDVYKYVDDDGVEQSFTSESSDHGDHGSDNETVDEILTSPTNDSPESFEAFMSKRVDSFADTNKPTRIPLPPIHSRNKKPSPKRRNSYLQGFMNNQQLEIIAEETEEPEQETFGQEQGEIGSELEDFQQDTEVRRNAEHKNGEQRFKAYFEEVGQYKETREGGHVEESGPQDYAKQGNIADFKQPGLFVMQHNLFLRTDTTDSIQERTVDAPSSFDFYSSETPPHQTSDTYQKSPSSHSCQSFPSNEILSNVHIATTSGFASGRRGGISHDSTCSSRNTKTKDTSGSRIGTFQEDEHYDKDLYHVLKMSLAEARINVPTDSSKHCQIDLLDPRFYYNPGGTDSLYDGPKEIAEKLGLTYTGSNIVIVCQEPLGCDCRAN